VPLVNFLHGQGLMDEKTNDFAAAIVAFRAELATFPNHFESNLFLGNLLREGGRPTRRCRAREAVGRLQSEGESRFFSGVSDALGRLLGRTAAEGAPAKP
jgi:hypothetical protein